MGKHTLSATKIEATPENEEQEAAYAVLAMWCKKHEVSHRNFINAIVPRIAFCLRNYTVEATPAGNPQTVMNLGIVEFINKTNARRKPRERKPYTNAF